MKIREGKRRSEVRRTTTAPNYCACATARWRGRAISRRQAERRLARMNRRQQQRTGVTRRHPAGAMR
ncbi:hypothetical protein [Musicola paradisiaca]|uniref:hypothetical protein n=1 Tax=Musicola paradisiaca TaxID=69223 RepID=UPI00384AEDD9